MTALLDKNPSVSQKSMCWTCTKAYALICDFHNIGLDWEERLKVPSNVTFRELQSNPNAPRVKYYKVLECEEYVESARAIADEKAEGNVTPIREKPVATISKEKSVATISEEKITYQCLVCGEEAKGQDFCSKICKIMGKSLRRREA